MFRTLPARWFECLSARDDLTQVVETLARTALVELETQSATEARIVLPDLQEGLNRYHQLAQSFQAYWPRGRRRAAEPPQRPLERLEQALAIIEHWRDTAEPLIRQIEAIQGEQGQLQLLQELLEALPDSTLNLQRFTQAGPALALRIYVLPLKALLQQQPGNLIILPVSTAEHRFIIALGAAPELTELEQGFLVQRGRRLSLPEWLGSDPQQSLNQLIAQRSANRDKLQRLEGRLQHLEQSHPLSEALGDIERLEWFVSHVDKLPVTDNFAWVSGWTRDTEGRELQAALQGAGVRVMLRFPPPPKGLNPPMVMRNPGWAQPFELFANLLGTPARDEADPSRLLFFIVPLLFGYMFGDLGQGALLLLAGLWLGRRYAPLRLLRPAGIASMAFGLLFGTVFCREDLIPALWLRPMDAPLTVLLLPLLGGALLLVLGLLLNGMEAYWRRAMASWWRQDAALLLLYLGLLGTWFYPYAILGAVLGLAWYLTGRFLESGATLQVLPAALGRLLEYTFQLLVNTLSFTRVGAFALAHAGLSLAIIGLAEASGHALFYVLILVLGNVLILVLEGLVVSIQITRLVLFEFFIRFLRGEGRRFHPLEAPPS